MHLNRIDEALSDLEVAVSISPQHSNAQTSLGRVRIALGQHEKGHEALMLALCGANAELQTNPSDALALYARARAYRSLGRLDEALVDLESSLRLHPKSAEIHCEHVYTLVEAGQYAEAFAAIQRVNSISDGCTCGPVSSALA